PEPQAAPTPAAMEAPRVAPPLPVTQPRFNADYLDNPKPPNPSASRRMGEEGEVRLRVHVDTAGQAQQIEVYRSSGFPRLDQAALDTVKQWRFVPARQGDQPIPAWVIVPIQFSLRS
ncbi:MAG: energy transducer TonB, partial [Thiobacillus sp.]|nr:energy transducer TonB [Thiobacillus sp.]